MSEQESAALEWEVRMGDEMPKKRLVVFVLALAAGLIGYSMFNNLLVGVGAVCAILFSAAEVFLPIKYRIDERGARSKCGLSVTEVLWGDVKRLIPVSNGIRVSPLASESRLDAFRGVLLRFAGNEDAVLAKIRQFWENDEHGNGVAGATESGEGGGDDRPTGRSDQQAAHGGSGDALS